MSTKSSLSSILADYVGTALNNIFDSTYVIAEWVNNAIDTNGGDGYINVPWF